MAIIENTQTQPIKRCPTATYLVHKPRLLKEAAMASRAKRDMTVEEFEAWCDARRNVAEVNEACAEEGGPRVSLVPKPISVPLDFLPDEVSLPAPFTPGPNAVPFAPAASRKAGGWSAA